MLCKVFTHVKQDYTLPELTQVNPKDGHRYYTDSNGHKYASITSVLSNKTPDYIVEWRKAVGDAAADLKIKQCSDRGVKIHDMSEKYLKNDSNYSYGYDPEIVKKFNSFKKTLNNIDNIWHQETKLSSKVLRIAGTVDCIGEYSGKLSIIDFKTSTKPKMKEACHNYFLQCTAYALMFYEATGILIPNIVLAFHIEKEPVYPVFREEIYKYINPLNLKIEEFYRERR